MVNRVQAPLGSVRIAGRSGRVRVRAVAGLDEVSVEGATTAVDGAELTVDGGSSAIEVRMPDGMDLVIGTSSGRVETFGKAGSVAVVTTSGRVSIDEADEVDVRSTSAKVTIAAVAGDCRVIVTNGSVTIGRCGPAHVSTASGRITMREVHGPAHAHSTSGRIDLTMATASDVDAETVSGRIAITMPPTARVRIDAPARTAVPVDAAHDCVVTARSGSGRVVVK